MRSKRRRGPRVRATTPIRKAVHAVLEAQRAWERASDRLEDLVADMLDRGEERELVAFLEAEGTSDAAQLVDQALVRSATYFERAGEDRALRLLGIVAPLLVTAGAPLPGEIPGEILDELVEGGALAGAFEAGDETSFFIDPIVYDAFSERLQSYTVLRRYGLDLDAHLLGGGPPPSHRPADPLGSAPPDEGRVRVALIVLGLISPVDDDPFETLDVHRGELQQSRAGELLRLALEGDFESAPQLPLTLLPLDGVAPAAWYAQTHADVVLAVDEAYRAATQRDAPAAPPSDDQGPLFELSVEHDESRLLAMLRCRLRPGGPTFLQLDLTTWHDVDPSTDYDFIAGVLQDLSPHYRATVRVAPLPQATGQI